MLRLVCYDIADTKRLRKIAKVCERFGIRLQKSCFQCDAEGPRFALLLKEIGKEMDQKKDSVIAYSICKDCLSISRTDGNGKILDPDRCIIL